MDEKKIRAQDKWDMKAGVSAKTYKVNTAVAEEFKKVCKELHCTGSTRRTA